MSENLETTVLNIHKQIKTKLESWPYETFIEDDGAGPFIMLYTPGSRVEDEDYRCLSLFSGKMESLPDYRWHFWNSSMNVWLTSDLGSDATEDEVLAFLQRGLDDEAQQ